MKKNNFSLWRFPGFILLAGLVLLLAGCYEVDKEVITAGMAEYVYDLPGTYYDDNKTRTEISAVSYSKDYRFQQYNEDKQGDSGYLRAVRLRDDIYILQAKFDDDTYYYLTFYEFRNKHYMPMWPDVTYQEIERLAGQYGIKMDFDDYMMVDMLTGDAVSIMNFLRAHASLPLRQGGAY